jgi:hypothetical protein
MAGLVEMPSTSLWIEEPRIGLLGVSSVGRLDKVLRSMSGAIQHFVGSLEAAKIRI